MMTQSRHVSDAKVFGWFVCGFFFFVEKRVYTINHYIEAIVNVE